MKRIYILLLISFLIFTCSSCNKYKLTDNAYELKDGDSRTNRIIYDDTNYYVYNGKLLITSKNSKSIITINNITYNPSGSIIEVSKQQSLVITNKKVYQISLHSYKENTKSNGEIVEYIKTRQAITINADSIILIDESYN